MVNLLKKEAERVGKRSVPDRIITMKEEAPDRLVVETTTKSWPNTWAGPCTRPTRAN